MRRFGKPASGHDMIDQFGAEQAGVVIGVEVEVEACADMAEKVDQFAGPVARCKTGWPQYHHPVDIEHGPRRR